MEITLNGIGKKFGKNWIFRNIDFTLPSQHKLVITGSNGSGKSTLLQIIAGYLIPDSGAITFSGSEKKPIPVEEIGTRLSIAAPYLELVEEFTLIELLNFHLIYRQFKSGFSVNDVIKISGLEKAASKQIRHYSSGMKQRVRLTIAILTESELLLLDEPSSNLDSAAVSWYQELLQEHGSGRSIIVSSNHQHQEYPGFTQFFEMEAFKK